MHNETENTYNMPIKSISLQQKDSNGQHCKLIVKKIICWAFHVWVELRWVDL